VVASVGMVVLLSGVVGSLSSIQTPSGRSMAPGSAVAQGVPGATK